MTKPIKMLWLTNRLAVMMARVRRRPPDKIIGGAENPYMLRWYVIRQNRFFNIYHHEIRRDDDDRALHDHPWASLSIILEGNMFEVLTSAGKRRFLYAGDIVARDAKSPHRLELNGTYCRTLFITGPRIREWGFHCPHGWRHWKIFTDFYRTGDSTRIGPGCD